LKVFLRRLHSRFKPRENRDRLSKSEELSGTWLNGQELTGVGWTESDLEKERKSVPEKLAIAALLRKETTSTVKEIAARLWLGTSRGAHAKETKSTKGG
jgi:hypothetical protein